MTLEEKCLEIIEKEQDKDGGFYHGEERYKTSFVVGLILQSLCAYNNPALINRVEKIRDKAAKFLLSEKSTEYSWNYFSKETSLKFTELKFPDDLDDTFICLSALTSWKNDLLDGNALAKITNLLIKQEVCLGGPYKTWITDSKEEVWQDADIAPNANIMSFLRRNKIELASLENFLKKSINGGLKSKYYPSTLPIVYFLSRSINVVEVLKNTPEGKNTMERALKISATILSGHPNDLSFEYSKLEEKFDIEDLEAPFCIDPSVKSKKFFCESSALTAAFVIEAISLFKNTEQDTKSLLSEKIIKQLSKLIPNDVITQSMGKRKEEILYPLQFLGTPGVDTKLLEKISKANLLGWVAYKITDDIMDDLTGTNLLPIAHICLREMHSIYFKIFNKPEERCLYKRILNSMDKAQYKGLTGSAKSMGHSLPLVAILLKLGISEHSKEMKGCIRFFDNYLAARQLSDDAHDWKGDLKKGIRNGALDIMGNIPHEDIDTFFWSSGIEKISNKISEHCLEAVKSLQNIEHILDTSFFKKIAKKAEEDSVKALRERDNIRQFIEYSRTVLPSRSL